MRGRIPNIARNIVHVAEVNLESLSETMSLGRPWVLHISFANILAKSAAVLFPSSSGMECAIFVNLSMIIHSSVCPSEFGKSVMKSILIDCQGACGSSSGDSRPYCLWRFALSARLFGHDCMYSTMSLFIPSHQKFLRINSVVLSCPKCPATLLSCSVDRISGISVFDTNRQFL